MAQKKKKNREHPEFISPFRRQDDPNRMKILYTKIVLNPPVDQNGRPNLDPTENLLPTPQELTDFHLELVEYHMKTIADRSLPLPDTIFILTYDTVDRPFTEAHLTAVRLSHTPA